jgi:hypothetical protein
MTPAAILLGLADWLMPAERKEWLAAMRAEAAHLPSGAALSWALGCVVSALKERTMLRTGTLDVSRWIFAFELLCFVPITIGWWDAVAGDSGVIRLNGEIISRYFLENAHSKFILAMMIASAVVGVVGPVGLMLSGRFILTGRGLRSRAAGFAMICVLLLVGAAWIVARVIWGTGAYAASFSSMLLLVFLPAAVLWHLMALARPSASMPPPVAVAA